MFQLLAEEGFNIPKEAIIFILVAIFSFLKWLFEKLAASNNDNQKSREKQLDGVYEMYRNEIRERQTIVESPPVIPEQLVPVPKQTQSPAPEPVSFTPRYSQEDIERAKANKKEPSAYAIAPTRTQKQKNSMNREKLISQLKNKNTLRQALIVREILGPPKGIEF